jgi:hypothetical protein
MPALLTEPDQHVDGWAAVVVDAALEVHFGERHLKTGIWRIVLSR